MTILLVLFQTVKNLGVRFFLPPDPDLVGIEIANFLTQVGSNLVIAFSVFAAVRYFDRRRYQNLGFHMNKAWSVDLGFGLGIGALVMGLIFASQLALGWIEITGVFSFPEGGIPFLPAIFMPLLGYLAVGLAEEAWIRGYVLTNLAEGFQNTFSRSALAVGSAAVFQAVLFGVLHANNPHASLLSTFNITVGAGMFALGYLLTGELAIPIGLHIAWNFFQGNVFGFPVSGGSSQAAQVISIHQAGPEVWTGGNFGPEAGLLGLLGFVFTCAAVILWAALRQGRLEIDDRISSPQPRKGKRGLQTVNLPSFYLKDPQVKLRKNKLYEE